MNLLYSTTGISFDLKDPDVTHVSVMLVPENPLHTAVMGMRYAGFHGEMSVADIVNGVENGDFPPYHEWSKQPHNA